VAFWVVGDLHGCFDEFMVMKDKIEAKDPSATLLLLGDIIDRGPKSRALMDWAIENVSPEGSYQMILGNHEDSLIRDFRNARFYFSKMFGGASNDISKRLSNYYHLEKEFVGVTFEEFEKYIRLFKSLPLYREVRVNNTNYVIAHAWYDRFRRPDTLLWYRDVDRCNSYRMKYTPIKDEILIHGHTPTILDDCTQHGITPGKVWDKGESINLDCGLVYKVAGPKEEPFCWGNLAAMNLETKEILYLFE